MSIKTVIHLRSDFSGKRQKKGVVLPTVACSSKTTVGQSDLGGAFSLLRKKISSYSIL